MTDGKNDCFKRVELNQARCGGVGAGATSFAKELSEPYDAMNLLSFKIIAGADFKKYLLV